MQVLFSIFFIFLQKRAYRKRRLGDFYLQDGVSFDFYRFRSTFWTNFKINSPNGHAPPTSDSRT